MDKVEKRDLTNKELGEKLDAAKTDITTLKRNTTRVSNRLKHAEEALNEKGALDHLEETSKRLREMSALTQSTLMKLNVLTEVNSYTNGGYEIMRVLFMMVDDSNCGELFKESKQLDVWVSEVKEYKRLNRL